MTVDLVSLLPLLPLFDPDWAEAVLPTTPRQIDSCRCSRHGTATTAGCPGCPKSSAAGVNADPHPAKDAHDDGPTRLGVPAPAAPTSRRSA